MATWWIENFGRPHYEEWMKPYEPERQFFETPEFNRLIEIIAQHERINGDELESGETVIPGMSSYEFGLLHRSVSLIFSSQSPPEGGHDTSYIRYVDIDFYRTENKETKIWTQRVHLD
tara:strand:+ start:353 stop:706 length:354 start_codon:yes stop_codon:yes gene_type:complete